MVRRVYVEKKKEYAVKERELFEDIKTYLSIDTLKDVHIFIRYDVENVSDETFEKACTTIFSEPPVDDLYKEELPIGASAEKMARGTDPSAQNPSARVFGVEYLPGQFDQRADSAVQCVQFLAPSENPVIRTATVYVLDGEISDADFDRIKSYCINPVDSRETDNAGKPDTLLMDYDDPEDVKIFDGFKDMAEAELKTLYDSLGLAMTFNDFKHIQNYFNSEEKRDPSFTEIKVLDTYWSDHCRHTTFSTELKDVEFEAPAADDAKFMEPIKASYDKYNATREEIFKGRSDKFPCLMDIALLAMRKLKADGKLDDMEITDEINACSIVVPVEIDGATEEWLVMFKNETHNHPTEIEPFGGAATCLGGAIRDPLSGRSYVYQAMRVTGAADPTVSLDKTLNGKLPQKKLVRGAAAGYSSYGNQIGLATGYVKEIYHPNYVAKRMEIGAVMGAAPRKNVIRETSDPGDIIILLGGRTGRDGCGGATGSSKVHTEQSIETCGAEVQKGNAPTERKLQRLFRREEVSKLIKKCNDFGAGGVSVAIGELADGLKVDLDKVPKKYAGLDGTELAISESQERMAVVVDPKDVKEFLAYAEEENLEATEVAVVTESPRLVLSWRGKEIVNLSRAFLDTNGAHQETKVVVEGPKEAALPFAADKKPMLDKVAKAVEAEDYKAAFTETLKDLNVCSQKGLVEMFDGSIGAGSVYMPYGGKYQLTETQGMVAKLPVLKGKCDTVTMMAYGFDPYISSWSPYHGAMYAVVESMARIVAMGGDYSKIRFTFQEYFQRMTEDPKRWSQPFTALLGAFEAQLQFGLPSIGGKDSMSGTFNDIDVPPTLVSFAVDVAKEKDVITPEFKAAGNKILLAKLSRSNDATPDFDQNKTVFDAVHADIQAGNIISAYVIDGKGMAAAIAKMAFGNGLGAKLDSCVHCLYAPEIGSFVLEVPADKATSLNSDIYSVIGEVTDDAAFTFKDGTKVSLDEALKAWKGTLEKVFPTIAVKGNEPVKSELYKADSIYVCKNKIAKPTVFIPVFPGTNCEYDSTKAFERAGANVITNVFTNMNEKNIKDSFEGFKKCIDQAQIIMFPGGFSAGDEPDGSAKFFATVFQNEMIKDAVSELLNSRDGLILGICNGFQALIKLGLVPNGAITGQDENAPTLTFNTINRHISKMAYTKVVSNKSPWLQGANLGDTYVIPASHGEGRFVANKEWLDKLFANGQVATQYVDVDGNASMDEEWNINGSYMAIEGITSADGRVFGKMGHSERRGDAVAMNIYGEHDMKIFESGVKYFQ